MIIKLTKPYYLEGKRFEEGTELVISSDGETETVNETPSEPQNQIDLGLVSEKTDEKAEGLASEKTDETSE